MPLWIQLALRVCDLNCHHKRSFKIKSCAQADNLSFCANKACTRGTKHKRCLLSKYALAKELLESGREKGKEFSLDVAAVMVVQSIQELILAKGAKYVKEFPKYEADSVSEKNVFEIQRR